MSKFSMICSNCQEKSFQSVDIVMAKNMGFDGIVCTKCYKALLEVKIAIESADNVSDCDTCCMGETCSNPEFGSKNGCDEYIEFESEE